MKTWTKEEILEVYNTPLIELVAKAGEIHKQFHKQQFTKWHKN
jgi:biotin synthase